MAFLAVLTIVVGLALVALSVLQIAFRTQDIVDKLLFAIGALAGALMAFGGWLGVQAAS